MRIKTFLFIAFLMFVSVESALSQEFIKETAIPQGQGEAEMQWVWGDVASVDLQNKLLVVQYLDYETDQEKEMSIAVDEKTTFENIKSMEEIIPKLTVSIDYVVGADGKFVARNLSVERPDDLGGMQEQGSLVEEQKMPSPASEAEEAVPDLKE